MEYIKEDSANLAEDDEMMVPQYREAKSVQNAESDTKFINNVPLNELSNICQFLNSEPLN